MPLRIRLFTALSSLVVSGKAAAGRVARLRKNPPFLIARKVLQKIPFELLDLNALYVLEFEGVPAPARVRGRGEVRRGTREDLPEMGRLENKLDLFSRRFAEGDRCVVAEIDGKIVGYEWFSTKPYHMEERFSYRLDLPVDSIYLYDAFIQPAYRLSGFWLKFKNLFRSEMEAQNLHKLVTMVDFDNTLSMNTHLRFGFRMTRKIIVLKAMGKTFSREESLKSKEDSP